ncbi:hypothetical protein SUDANB105_07648 [Streptomyces sp. enrichment culture]
MWRMAESSSFVHLDIADREFNLDPDGDDFEADANQILVPGRQEESSGSVDFTVAPVLNPDENDPRKPRLDTEDFDLYPVHLRVVDAGTAPTGAWSGPASPNWTRDTGGRRGRSGSGGDRGSGRHRDRHRHAFWTGGCCRGPADGPRAAGQYETWADRARGTGDGTGRSAGPGRGHDGTAQGGPGGPRSPAHLGDAPGHCDVADDGQRDLPREQGSRQPDRARVDHHQQARFDWRHGGARRRS